MHGNDYTLALHTVAKVSTEVVPHEQFNLKCIVSLLEREAEARVQLRTAS